MDVEVAAGAEQAVLTSVPRVRLVDAGGPDEALAVLVGGKPKEEEAAEQ